MPSLDDFGGLIDWPGLNAWIAGQNAPGSGPVTAARKLVGGIQNNVFLLERGSESLVLRRPAKQLRANSNETMLREARDPQRSRRKRGAASDRLCGMR